MQKNIRSVPKGQEMMATFILAVIMGIGQKEQGLVRNSGIHSLHDEEVGTASPWRGLFELGEKS